MPTAVLDNATALPAGFLPMRGVGQRDSFLPLAQPGKDDQFRSLLGIDRATLTSDDAEPIMFPDERPGVEQTLMDRLGAQRPAAKGQKDELREAAEQLVSTTLIMPLFDQLRSDPLAANLFHGGQAESVFRRQLDQTLADRIAGSSGFDLVDSIYDQFAKYAKASAGAHGLDKGVDLRG